MSEWGWISLDISIYILCPYGYLFLYWYLSALYILRSFIPWLCFWWVSCGEIYIYQINSLPLRLWACVPLRNRSCLLYSSPAATCPHKAAYIMRLGDMFIWRRQNSTLCHESASLCYVYRKIKLAVLGHLLVYRVVKNHGPHVRRIEIKRRDHIF